MTPDVIDYLKEIADSAIARCHERVADRKFFVSVKRRLELGEDLSAELPQLKHVSAKKAVLIVDKLIQRCDSDMTGYWTMPNASGIQSKVSMEMQEQELIPRFTAKYSTKTEVGAVAFTVTSRGNHADFDIDTSRVKTMDKDAAVKELANQLLAAQIAAN